MSGLLWWVNMNHGSIWLWKADGLPKRLQKVCGAWNKYFGRQFLSNKKKLKPTGTDFASDTAQLQTDIAIQSKLSLLFLQLRLTRRGENQNCIIKQKIKIKNDNQLQWQTKTALDRFVPLCCQTNGHSIGSPWLIQRQPLQFELVRGDWLSILHFGIPIAQGSQILWYFEKCPTRQFHFYNVTHK